jgi:methylaspartate ammonia-lyase
LRIQKAIAIPAWGGYYNEDLNAIRSGARPDGLFFSDPPKSPGFRSIRQPSEASSILLILDDQRVAFGDALSVDYATEGGRSGLFSAAQQVPLLNEICRSLAGKSIGGFVAMCEELEDSVSRQGLHLPAAMFGLSQAILQAVAMERKVTCAEVVANEIGTVIGDELIPLGIQCGEYRHDAVDKAIAKRVEVLPHGLVNDLETTVGAEGVKLKQYVSWIVERIRTYGTAGYAPRIHLDLYGQLGAAFDHDLERMSIFLCDLEHRAAPYQLCIETPVLMDSRESQLSLMMSLRAALEERGSAVQLIVDEWANDLDDIRSFVSAGAAHMIHIKTPDLGSLHRSAQAVVECRAGGVAPVLGGSCAETDQSARLVAHVALATSPEWVLARPGMGVDEGVQLMHNEMARTLAIIKARAR